MAAANDAVGKVRTLTERCAKLDAEIEIARSTLESRQKSLRLVSLRLDEGVANKVELRQAEGLVLSRLQPESNGAVSVVLQGQEFNAVIRWLHRLQETNGVSIQRVSLDADGRPGYVNAQLRLR